jgi:tetratricopeptide (TPR) repeat protein
LTTRHHGETEARTEGFEGRIEDAFEWATAHAREVVIGIVAFLVIGGGIALGWELERRSAEEAQRHLAEVEIGYSLAMGASPRAAFPAEPANPDQAVRAREAALAGFEEVADHHAGSVGAEIAMLRAAEMEIELGRTEAAAERLQALADEADAASLTRGGALRLRGYALETLGRDGEAGEAYAAAGAVTGYPDRPAVWLSAADSYARAGDGDRELEVYQRIIELDPAFADQNQVTERLDALGGAAAAPPAP